MTKSDRPILDDIENLRQRQRADGSWRVWWEPSRRLQAAGCKTVDLSDLRPGDAARKARALNAAAERGAAQAGRAARVSARSIAALVADYRQSLGFRAKRASTQRAYGADLKAIEAKWGPHPVAAFDKPLVARWYEALHAAKGPVRARAILRMMSILMMHAELRGMRPENSNPCRGLRTETPMERDRTASWAEFDALVAAAQQLDNPHILTALHLAVLAGQRQYDIRAVRPGDFLTQQSRRGKPLLVWRLVQSKRARALDMPIHDEADPVIRAQIMRAANGPGTLIWNAATGQPYTDKAFWSHWAQVRDLAAKTVPDCATIQWRDLRRTFANMSRAGGASVWDAGDALGNTAAANPRLRATYMAPQIDTTLRAVQAVRRPKPQAKG